MPLPGRWCCNLRLSKIKISNTHKLETLHSISNFQQQRIHPFENKKGRRMTFKFLQSLSPGHRDLVWIKPYFSFHCDQLNPWTADIPATSKGQISSFGFSVTNNCFVIHSVVGFNDEMNDLAGHLGVHVQVVQVGPCLLLLIDLSNVLVAALYRKIIIWFLHELYAGIYYIRSGIFIEWAHG